MFHIAHTTKESGGAVCVGLRIIMKGFAGNVFGNSGALKVLLLWARNNGLFS